MESEEKKHLLPLGSVVLLKNANKEIMITGYYIAPMKKAYKNTEGLKLTRDKIYDYCGCHYPEGIMNSDAILVFNHNQIDKLIYLGYDTEELQKHFEEMDKNIEDLMNEKIILDENDNSIETNSSDIQE